MQMFASSEERHKRGFILNKTQNIKRIRVIYLYKFIYILFRLWITCLILCVSATFLYFAQTTGRTEEVHTLIIFIAFIIHHRVKTQLASFVKACEVAGRDSGEDFLSWMSAPVQSPHHVQARPLSDLSTTKRNSPDFQHPPVIWEKDEISRTRV